MRITVLSPAYPPRPGGGADYSWRWCQAMHDARGDSNQTLTVLTGPGAATDDPWEVRADQNAWGLRDVPRLMRAIAATRPDVVVMQYVPHLYERRGLSIGAAGLAFGLARRGVPLVLHAQELYYARYEALRHQPIGWVQRAALWPLFGASRRVVLTVPDRLIRMRTLFPRWAARFVLIPVGHNIDAPANLDRADWRASQGLAPDELLLVFNGLGHPSQSVEHLALVLDHLAARGLKARLWLVGGARLDHPQARVLGMLPAEEAGAILAGADLAVLPFGDGASTRRGSLMNALAAGLPVVSTRGTNTDLNLFAPDSVCLVPAGDPDALADAVLTLCQDAPRRAALGRAGRALHGSNFAWPVLARQWQTILDEAVGQSALTRTIVGDN